MSSISFRFRPAAGPALRIAVALMVAITILGASGCRWFRKGDPYAMAPESRPLEAPPELDMQEVERSATTTASGSVSRSSLGGGTQASPLGFSLGMDQKTAFARVGEALAATEGLTIVSRAQLLGAFDVDYEGSKFLVRVSESAGGSLVAAVDPRGLAAQGAAPAKLMGALKAALQP